YIPMKVLSVGVLPLIFAYSFMAFPTTIVGLIGGANSSAYKWCEEYLSQGAWPYIVICALLIVAFAYFYTAITFNPQDIAKNVQQQGGHIQGIRPGQATVNFLQKTSTRLTLFAGIFLAILATIPSAIPRTLIAIPFGASSIMIAVSVALETVRGVEAQLVMRNYKGFL
ncbi:MAG: preprotein translocase subunit SecY, partial [Clostridiales bacterium]|nr:preprotein translocase subunit SecY [Clostridiales bacterium]